MKSKKEAVAGAEVIVFEDRKPDGWPVLVKALRGASVGIEVAADQTGNEKTFFPPRAKGERQPIALRGYVPLKDVANLVHYIADMLEP